MSFVSFAVRRLATFLLGLMLFAMDVSAASDAVETDFSTLAQPGKHRLSISVDGHDRVFDFVTPKGFAPGRALPLVFFLHGAGGSAEQAYRTYGWAAKADAEKFFVAFPQALGPRVDGTGQFRIWRDRRVERPGSVDDDHFFEVLLDRLEGALPVDTRRVYVTGFSNGAGMTFDLGAHFASRLAAIAPVASQSFVEVTAITRAVPVYYLCGTADPLIPYFGGRVRLPEIPFGPLAEYPPVRKSAEQWAALDGCPATPQLLSDANGVKVERYGPGRDGAEVIFTSVEGNGHHWPGSHEPLPRFISGPVLDPFNATDRIWEFFVKHPLPG